MGNASIYWGQSGWAVALTTHPYLEPSLTFLWAFVTCYRANFALFYEGVLINPFANIEHEIIGL
jgi:hypothetical protein